MQSEKSNKSQFRLSPTLNPNRVFILQKSELEKRFDPIYYAHEYNHFDKKLRKKPFKKFHQILKSINNGYDFRDYKDSGTPYLKVANVKQGELDFTKIQYIDFNSSEISKNIQLKKGNLLLTRKGTFGNAFALDKDYDFVISSEVFYIELQDNSINPKFLEIFFNSKIGQAQFDKNKIGAIMGSLSQEAIRDLNIPLPSSEIQNQIVGIYESYVAQKQKNEAEAEKLLSSIDDYLLKELGIKLPEPPENTLKNRMFVTTLQEITGGRFDPKYYSLKYTNLQSALDKSKYKFQKIKSFLSSLSMGISTPEYKSENKEVPFILGKNLKKGFLDLDDLEYISEEINNANKSSILKENDILFSVRGVYIGKVAVVPKEIEGANIINNIVKFSLNGINPNFVVAYLNSSIGQEFIYREVWGGAQPGFTNEQIKDFPIPVPPLAKQKEIADHITAIRQQAQQLKDQTKELLKKASEEIEEILLN
jgi:restriction endonuclease S subunit